MAQTWILTEIITKYRDITGLKSTSQQEAAAAKIFINDYYQNYFPLGSGLDRFKTDFTQDTSVDDDGNYLIDEDYLEVKEPASINNFPCRIYRDKGKFDNEFPKETGTFCITEPGLVIGTTSTASVKNAAFKYRIGDYSYSKAAGETALSGDDIPKSKYGAYRLEIDADGDISIVEADNATGYSTAAQAVRALEVESSDNACMGYITVINTSAVFDPGITGLDDSGVTATFTDGFHSTRGIPYTALITGRRLYLGPKPNDIFQFKAVGVKRPDALEDDTAPLDITWGIAIAYGAAVLRLSETDDEDHFGRIVAALEAVLNMIRRPDLLANGQKRASPKW